MTQLVNCIYCRAAEWFQCQTGRYALGNRNCGFEWKRMCRMGRLVRDLVIYIFFDVTVFYAVGSAVLGIDLCFSHHRPFHLWLS